MNLQEWSVTFQAVNSALLAVFFTVLARSIKIPEVRYWSVAWLSNLVALSAVIATFPSLPPPVYRFLLCLYAAAKTVFVVFLVAGGLYHVRPGKRLQLGARILAPLVMAWALLLGLFAETLADIQLAEYLMVGFLSLAGGVQVMRYPQRARSRWLGVALSLHGILFLHSCVLLSPIIWHGPVFGPGYFSVSSSLDAVAELLVALTSLAALESLGMERLKRMNRELVASRDHLRMLVDRDPLTGLLNRRGLREALDTATEKEAAVIFLDVDDFKAINDRHGHFVGDECLKRAARGLLKAFRQMDYLFRWGGDEFLVVCPGLNPEAAEARLTKLSAELAREDQDVPSLSITWGMARLSPEANPDQVLKEADARMYAKRKRTRLRPLIPP